MKKKPPLRKPLGSRNPIAAIVRLIKKKVIPNKKKYNRKTDKNFGFDP